MTLGVLQLEFRIPGADSLKEKRHAIRPFKDRIAHGFNVSIAETDAQDEHRRAVFGVAMVGTDRPYVEGALARIVDRARAAADMTLSDFRIDFI